MTLHQEIESDLWRWVTDFVSVPNEFYGKKFAPCPYAKSALLEGQLDVVIWRSEEPRAFVLAQANEMTHRRAATGITTRLMAFPPRVQRSWGFISFLDALNLRMMGDNVFLNAGIAKTTRSRYPGSQEKPYFIVIANTLDGVLKASDTLQRTGFYSKWPAEQYRTVVERRSRLAAAHRPSNEPNSEARAVPGPQEE